MGRIRFLLVGVPSLTLALLGVLADRALLEQARAVAEASRAQEEENAELTARTVTATLRRIEDDILRGDPRPGVAPTRLADPKPTAPAPSDVPYLERSEEELITLSSSTGVSASGLPEAVVAAVALDRDEISARVSERLLSGRLPLRPQDLPYLAEVLGVSSDSPIEPLERRLLRAPALSRLPEAPSFRRRLLEGDVVEGWSRRSGEIVGYEIPVLDWIALAGFSGRAFPSSAPAGAIDEAGRRIVAISDVEGLALAVARKEPSALRIQLLRGLLWIAVLVSIGGLASVLSGVRRERRALARERAFLASVTHELRTPLAAVRLFGERLAEGRGNAKAYGSMVALESRRLEELVERVLSTTRADEKLTIAPLDPVKLLRSTIELASARAEQRDVTLELEERSLPEARWDAEAVRQAVLNLLDNAIKHGRKGGHVRVRSSVEDGWIQISVSDDGPGIGAQDRERIFGRFERGPTEATGTGLGLYVVERIARAHGGRVDLKTEENRGATFTLVLPREARS